MDALKAKYATQLDQYNTLSSQAIQAEDTSQIPKLREMNIAIAGTLNEMIEKLTGAKSIPVIIFDDGSYLIEPSNDALGEKVGIVKS